MQALAVAHPVLSTISICLRKILAPEPCLLCGKGLLTVCVACQTQLAGVAVWERLGQTPLCTSSSRHSTVMTLLRAFKDDQRVALAAHLGEVLWAPLTAALESFPDVDGVLVVPTRRRAWRTRGFHPTKLILRSMKIATVNGVARERTWNDQRGLTLSDRRNNVHGAFRAHVRVRGRRFVVVDDVVTSGATALEVVRAVSEAGGRVLCVVAVSHVPVGGLNTPIKLHG